MVCLKVIKWAFQMIKGVRIKMAGSAILILSVMTTEASNGRF